MNKAKKRNQKETAPVPVGVAERIKQMKDRREAAAQIGRKQRS